MKQPEKKITKDAANYRVQANNRHCEDCSMFRIGLAASPIGSCTLVEGRIARQGTCRFWERKKGGT